RAGVKAAAKTGAMTAVAPPVTRMAMTNMTNTVVTTTVDDAAIATIAGELT
ncbi:MAG: hypothetical protein JWP29_4270, partial [Rhodoferax sp.]|nr:hypothetical protein [Rhodoferax sp.]